ncbi:MAG: transporter [Actinomycetia bacterium]|nr:transporter [Actinomycetes bacterium]
MSETTAPQSTVADDENAGRLDGASNGRLLLILIALVAFSEIVPFQYAMIGVLIPKIGAAFPASGSSTSWALTILGVVGAATMALAGKASDLWGKKRTLLIVGVFFLIGTLVCAVTSNWAVFLVGRGLQAVCLGIPAVGYGIVRDLLPRRWIPVAIGLLATGLGLSAVAAPLIGGLLTDHYSWRSVFWFLLIYAVVSAVGLIAFVPESAYRVRERFDWLGALLIGAGVAGVLIYVSEGTNWGWGNLSNLAYLIGGLILLVGFVAWENHIDYPMMELSLLRTPRVSMVMLIAVFATICIAVPNYTIPYMMETPTPNSLRNQILTQAAAKEHVSAALVKPYIMFQGDINYAAGMTVFQLAWHITIVLSVAAMIFGPLGGLLARRYGARLPMVLGTLSLLIAFELWTPFHGAWVDQTVIGIFWGIGFGFYYAASPNLLIDAVPATRQGISAGMLAVFGSIGSALATALLTPILAAHPYYLVGTPPGGKPEHSVIPQVYTNVGYTEVYLFVGCSAAVIALILALALQSGRTPARGGVYLEPSSAEVPPREAAVQEAQSQAAASPHTLGVKSPSQDAPPETTAEA